MYNIVFFGPQGSGKGTQAELLEQKLRLPRIEAGQLWRKEIEAGTDLGRAQAERQRQGILALDEYTNELMRRRLANDDVHNGYIIDGYPRSPAQRDALDTIAPPNQVIYLTLSDADAIKRLTGRLFCKRCGRTYHIVYNPPAEQLGKTWYCDDDHGPLMIREDDRPESIKKRLDIYHDQTEPIIEAYRARGIVHEINAAKSIEQVQVDIVKALGVI